MIDKHCRLWSDATLFSIGSALFAQAFLSEYFGYIIMASFPSNNWIRTLILMWNVRKGSLFHLQVAKVWVSLCIGPSLFADLLCSRWHFEFFFFFFFQRKLGLTLHVIYHLLIRRFSWNVKFYFLWKNHKISFRTLSATNLLSILMVNKFLLLIMCPHLGEGVGGHCFWCKSFWVGVMALAWWSWRDMLLSAQYLLNQWLGSYQIFMDI